MNLSDLQSRDIVTLDGKFIGNIIDIIIENGKIEYLIAGKNKFLISLFSSKDEYKIKWEEIQKIGDDVILINKVEEE